LIRLHEKISELQFKAIQYYYNMWFLFLVLVCPVACQEPHYRYNFSSIEWNGPGSRVCTSTEKLREKIKEDVYLLLNRSVEKSLDIRLEVHKHLFMKIFINQKRLMVHMLME
jgi:hypothetical protein